MLACSAGLLSTMVGCHGGKGVAWAESSAPSIRVNQLGYIPHGPKWAILRSGSKTSVDVRLLQGGKEVWSGKSTPKGIDPASGDSVHHVDFTGYEEEGQGYVLRSAKHESFPFAISKDLYSKLPYHALKYFYHNRSGTPITLPYAEAQTYTRPAGHLSDTSVPCWLPEECTYSLDVSGGWYDAGDHGKYVVNGGISAWTLLALYERLAFSSETADRWGDGLLNIPESGNGIPDILDEARWEVEFLLKMQVPQGLPSAGMAHHKMHDHSWSPLAFEPPAQATNRALHPPSTAATLNLAAVAAQSSRIWRHADPDFSKRCLVAAETAYKAAKENPIRLAPLLDKNGGGPYSDEHVTDEFFWAAAELFVTTGKRAYKKAVEDSDHYKSFPTRLEQPDGGADGDGVTGSLSWQSTSALGWISLAVVPSSLSDEERARLRAEIVEAGDTYLGVIEQEGYRLPLGLGPSKKYPWGSNSFVLNNMLVLTLAYDFAKADKYAEGVVQGMDYILGRNPMVQSYITGYGTAPLEQPHHRFWAHAKNRRFPKPPPGAVSGGPNSSLQDPQTKKSGLSSDLPPQKCFVDHIDAWSVNEITINWNAPLAWNAIFLADWARK